MSTGSIHLKFSAKFAAQVWKIYPDAYLPLLLVEFREASQYQASFSLLDLTSGDWVWQNFQLDEPWWIGAYGLQNGRMFLFNYEQSERPEPSNILVFEAKSQSLLWQREDVRFLRFISEDLIEVNSKEQVENDEILTINAENGLADNIAKKTLSERLVVSFPQTYRENEQYFGEFEDFFASHLGIKIQESIDYLEHKEHIIISYFFEQNRKKRNKLLILDAKVQILLNENIQSKIQGLSVDTFFIYHTYLIFIRNNIELVIYQINTQI